MTERGAGALRRDAGRLEVGPSRMRWEDGGLTVEVAERAVPHLTPLRGRVRLTPAALTGQAFALDAARRHVWRPYAPVARIEVAFERPRLRWSGHGYLDGNEGARPLEADFLTWDWTRARTDGGAAVFYDARRADGTTLGLALGFDAAGAVAPRPAPPETPLPGTLWRVSGATRSDAAPRLLRRLEDAPFYRRQALGLTLDGAAVPAMHETLDLRRFGAAWVKALLPFRMPRIG